MYFLGINAGAQAAIILLACGPCVVIVNCWDRFCTLGRAPRTKETLPDFHEWCWVTRHLRVFRGLTGCQRTPGFGASQLISDISSIYPNISVICIENVALFGSTTLKTNSPNTPTLG